MSQALIKTLSEQRANIYESVKASLDRAAAEERDLTVEEQAEFEARNADLDALGQRIKSIQAFEERSEQMAAMLDRPQVRPENEQRGGDADLETNLRSLLLGEPSAKPIEIRAHRPVGPNGFAEFRDLSKLTAAAGANTVKTSFYESLMIHLIEMSGVLAAGPTMMNTTTGEQIQVPRTTAHPTSVQTAEAAAIAESDPTFGQVPIDAYKYPHMVQLTRELVEDTSVDLLGYVAEAAGWAVGNAFGVKLATGTGTNEPNGVVTAATVGVTGSAGVAGAFTYESLVDLFHSVIAPYRRSPSCGWLIRDTTMAGIRKLKDGAGNYIFTPGIAGAPDRVLEKPVNYDPSIPAVGLGARSVLFGDFRRYFVRMVNGIRFERSDHVGFANDLVTFKTVIRGDGDLVDTTGSIKAFVGNAA